MTPFEAPPQIARALPPLVAQALAALLDRRHEPRRQAEDVVARPARRPERRQVGDDVEVLAGERMPRLVDRAEHALEVDAPEVVDVLVEDVEPGVVRRDPVEARHLDVDRAAAAVGLAQAGEEGDRVLDVLEDVAQHDPLGADADRGREELADDARVRPFVGRVEPGHVEAGAEQPLEEEALAAADLDQAPAGEVAPHHVEDGVEVARERAAQALLVLVVGVVLDQLGSKGAVEDQPALGRLHQHDVAARAGARRLRAREHAVLQHRQLLGAVDLAQGVVARVHSACRHRFSLAASPQKAIGSWAGYG